MMLTTETQASLRGSNTRLAVALQQIGDAHGLGDRARLAASELERPASAWYPPETLRTLGEALAVLAEAMATVQPRKKPGPAER